mgnify:FL=1
MPIYFEADSLPDNGSIVVFSRRDETTRVMAELQRFTLLRVDPTTNRYGEASGVMNWRSDCMDCGKSYDFTTGLSTGSFYRRCKKCRKGRGFTGWPKGPRIQHTLMAEGGTVPAVEPERELDPWSLLGSADRMAMLRQAKAELGEGASRDAIEAKARKTLLSLF